MLFIGVECTFKGCNLSAVSPRFTFLGQGFYYYDNKDQMESWARSLIISNNEKIAWFFSEKNYHLEDTPRSLFSFPDISHTHYLVKDRVVLDFQRVINDVNSAYNRLELELSFILAMSFYLFESKYIKLYSVSEQLSLWP